MRLFTPVACTLLCASAFAQDAPPKFDVADVHLSPKGVKGGGVYMHGGRMEVHGATMLHLLDMAYGIPEEQIFGGPNWLDTTRFDVAAKTGAPLTQDSLHTMMQSLLAERFGLVVRREDRPEPIFALVKGKHVQLKPSTVEADQGCQKINQDGYIVMTCRHITMEVLAARLPGNAPNYFDHPVIDKTGLNGAYDVVLKWSGRGQLGAGDADHPGISLFDYLDKQLGIAIEKQTRPSPALVIEHLNETPTPNPPGTVEKLPPPVTEFEVAEIRPSKPDTQQRGDMKNGRLEAIGFSMKDLLSFAYNLDEYQVVSPEKWLDSDKFDVIAKAAPDTTETTLQWMLRSLIEQRFHIKSHEEQQPVPVYALTAPKGEGKLRVSKGEEHAGCVRTPKDGALVYTCRNTTMAQLVDKLPDVAGARQYLDHPLVDLTGLKGSYDFEFTWAPPARFRNNIAKGGEGANAAAPVSGFTLFEAFDKQLGLKLAQDKHLMPVTVIDHIDRTPSDN